MNNDKIIAYVYQTTDYTKFRTIKGNRFHVPSHVRGLIKSMKEQLLFTIIYVNENFEILDGQNRFLALQEQGEPVNYCIIENYGIDEIIRYQGSKKWVLADYINYYCTIGNEHYITLQKLINEFPDVEANIISNGLMTDYLQSSGNGFKHVRQGTFTVKHEQSTRLGLQKLQRALFCFAKANISFNNNNRFIRGLMMLLDNYNISIAELERRVNLYNELLLPKISANEYYRMLIHFMEYNNKKTKLIPRKAA